MTKQALNKKQQAFVDAYLQYWNATKAARRAGYAGSGIRVTAHRLMQREDVQEEIRQRVAENAMSANETLARLAAQARADIGPFMNNEGEIDIGAMKEAGATHLLRKVKYSRRSGVNKDGSEWENVTVDVEMYSAQTALELIGKSHKLFTDRVEHEGRVTVDITGDDLAQARDELEEWKQEFETQKSSG